MQGLAIGCSLILSEYAFDSEVLMMIRPLLVNSLSFVRDDSADDSPIRSDDRQSLVRRDGQRDVSVRDDVPGGLLQHRGRAIGWGRRLLDGPPPDGLLRRPMPAGARRVLRHSAMTFP